MNPIDPNINTRLGAIQDAQSADRKRQELLEKRMDHQDKALDRIGRDVQKVLALLSETPHFVRANLATTGHRAAETIYLEVKLPPEARPQDRLG